MKALHEYTEELYHCIRCGFCTKVCPVYNTVNREMAVSRGRIRLMREHLDGNLELTPKMMEYLDSCLGCRTCVTNCPPQVPTDEIVRAARTKYAQNQGQPLMRHVMLHNVMNKPERFSKAFGSLKLARTTGLNRLLPKTLKARENLLPNLPERTFKEELKELAIKKSTKKVGFFLGCMDNNLYPQIIRAAINVLERLGYEPVIPTNVVCCGAAHHTYGDMNIGRKLALKNIKVFSNIDADVILTDCATCGSTLQSYGKLFQNQREEAEASNFARKVMDINEFLKGKLIPGDLPVQETVTYHDPCHLVRYQNVKESPRMVLAAAGAKLEEMSEADRCCGGGGTYNIFHYDISMKILDRKIANVKKTGATILATSCPACRIQLAHGIKRHGLSIEVLHPIELLAKSYGNGGEGQAEELH
ncbi:MAG: Lactate utilization protein A [Candidatus Dichloromethanomonas elyunquensis]|nr:MAG: Lactate utilization protein A [Candidatus Dichloromethanomonas elyunquensis]